MTLTPGTRIGPYEVVAPLGAGGMGEVYKARDTRLDRSVALKVLAAETAGDTELRGRFEREARVVAALEHPHICALYDVGDADGVHYFVMPLLDGQTLAARLEKGRLPIAQVLTIATQIADALDKAHRRGVVHRDLKPSNIMLTKSGAVLLDFGLAKLKGPAAPLSMTKMAELATSMTRTARGTLLGTVPYMAPEQVEGRDADARCDLWALGAVMYEMATGVRPFTGESPASVIGAILKDVPAPISTHQPLVPSLLDHVVARCLEKDPDARWQSAADIHHALTWIAEGAGSPELKAAGPSSAGRRLWPASAAIAAVAAIALGLSAPWTTPPPVRDVRFSVQPERGSTFSPAPASVLTPQFALSHDGSSLVFIATSGGRAALWVRPLDALEAHPLPGTEDANYPFWSPDGRTIAFFAQGKLKVVSRDGGTAVVVTDASFDSRGGAWAPDGTILINRVANRGLELVSANGTSTPVATVDAAAGESSLRWPSWLPDSHHFLTVARNHNDERRGIYLGALSDPARSLLVNSDWGAAVVDDRLLFLRGSTLMAQTVDVRQKRLSGDPVALLDGVGAGTSGYSAFSASATGTLAYARPWPTLGELQWFDRSGRKIGDPVARLADYVDFSLSPDASRLAISRVDPQTNTGDIWIIDFTRSGIETRLTSDRLNDSGALWSPDASRIYFRSNRRGVNSLYARPVNASRPEELVFEQAGEFASSMISSSISRDGSRLLFSNSGLLSSFDVWELAIGPTPTSTPLLQSAFNENQATFSPDGRWIAFVSDEAGPRQVYIQSYPSGDQRQPVSSRGGSEPQWRADGRELFFISEERVLMAASFANGVAGVPAPLFRTRVPVTGNPYRMPYAVSPDGQRFLVNTAPEDTPPPAIHIVLDWRALLPAERR